MVSEAQRSRIYMSGCKNFTMSRSHLLFGKKGEELAAQWLEQAGYQIYEKNYAVKYGEIDIIAGKGDLLIFVEVKIRQQAYFYLSQLIAPSKQRKIIKAALWYIAQQHITNMIYRFDVALLEGDVNNYTMHYIENAFTKEQC